MHNRLIQRRVVPHVAFVDEHQQQFYGLDHARLFSFRQATSQYRAGSANSVRMSVDSSPPTTTVANGRWTSDPMPVARAAGTIPSMATTIIMRTGRIWASAPRITASRASIPISLRLRLISETMRTPLITATPNSEMKPTAADTLKLMPRRYSANTPPTSENGTLSSTSPAYVVDPNVKNNNAKITAIVTGRMNVSRLRARARFSN